MWILVFVFSKIKWSKGLWKFEKCYLLLILMLLKLEAVMIKNIFKDFKKINNSWVIRSRNYIRI